MKVQATNKSSAEDRSHAITIARQVTRELNANSVNWSMTFEKGNSGTNMVIDIAKKAEPKTEVEDAPKSPATPEPEPVETAAKKK
ncbi:hypothetical protein [Rosistilla oblonga]|uniref:hypothetical protein n=1 Tax=Rosistilla oblonga TaxID=2527990 RepID=UPI003A96F54E